MLRGGKQMKKYSIYNLNQYKTVVICYSNKVINCILNERSHLESIILNVKQNASSPCLQQFTNCHTLTKGF